MLVDCAEIGLCEWVINIMKYYEIWTIVEPKRKALSQATMEYTAASNKLMALNEKIDVRLKVDYTHVYSIY